MKQYSEARPSASLFHVEQHSQGVMLPSGQMPPERIGDRIRRLREARNLKQHRLADLAEVHRNTLLAIEKGRSVPEPETVARIAAVLEVEPAVLWHGTAEGEWPPDPVNRVPEPDHPYEADSGSPAERLLDLLGMHDATRRAAGLLHRGQTLITIAYTIAVDDRWPLEEIRKIDALRDEILEEERARGD